MWQISLLNSNHDKAQFCCGNDTLDNYIRKSAKQDMKRHISNVFAATKKNANRIYGYYTLSSSSISLCDLPENVQRKLPRYPSVPAALLGRLAVDKEVQGQGLGAYLLVSSIKRIIDSELAWTVFIIKAKDDNASAFYQQFGFSPFKSVPSLLWCTRKELKILM